MEQAALSVEWVLWELKRQREQMEQLVVLFEREQEVLLLLRAWAFEGRVVNTIEAKKVNAKLEVWITATTYV